MRNRRNFWKIINSVNKTDQTTAPLEDLYNYFKQLNASDDQEESSDETLPQSAFTISTDIHEFINRQITESEIFAAV